METEHCLRVCSLAPYLTMRGRNMVLLTYLMVLSCSTFHTSVIRDLVITCLQSLNTVGTIRMKAESTFDA